MYNQVSLIAVNLIDGFADDFDTDEEAHRWDYIPPNEVLSFDIYQDPEVGNAICRLGKLKQSAVMQECFDPAQKICDTIAVLQQVAERLSWSNLEKQEAIEVENYERAKLKKFQINELRSNMVRDLDLMNLLKDTSIMPHTPIDVSHLDTTVIWMPLACFCKRTLNIHSYIHMLFSRTCLLVVFSPFRVKHSVNRVWLKVLLPIKLVF